MGFDLLGTSTTDFAASSACFRLAAVDTSKRGPDGDTAAPDCGGRHKLPVGPWLKLAATFNGSDCSLPTEAV